MFITSQPNHVGDSRTHAVIEANVSMIQTVTELMTLKVVSLICDRYYIFDGYCHVVCHMQYCMQHFRKGPNPF